jgi:hypothetical protein
MAEFIIRISFIVIILLFYLLGEYLSKCIDSPIEFKNILPVCSLVFWDYYFNLFTSCLLKLDVINKSVMQTDGKINKMRTTLKLSYRGNKDIHFRLNNIKIKGIEIAPTLIHKNQNYNIPEKFECHLEKNSPELIKIECTLKKMPVHRISILHYYVYFFIMKMQYTINYDINKTKRIFFIKKIKKI